MTFKKAGTRSRVRSHGSVLPACPGAGISASSDSPDQRPANGGTPPPWAQLVTRSKTEASAVSSQPQLASLSEIRPNRDRADRPDLPPSGGGIIAPRYPIRSAGLRAFSPSFPLTQRHAVYVHNLEADLRPIRRDWVGRSSLKVAGSRSSSRKHPATGRPHRAAADARYAAEADVHPEAAAA
jgi:hypothetical protein